MDLAHRLTGNRTEAEDLTLETFVAPYQRWQTFRGDGSPLSWLLGVAARRWRDGRRCRAAGKNACRRDTRGCQRCSRHLGHNSPRLWAGSASGGPRGG